MTLLRRAPRAALVTFAFALGEVLAVRARLPPGSAGVLALLQTFAYAGVAALLAAVAIAALAELASERLRRSELWSSAARGRAAAASALVVVPAALWAIFELELAGDRLFKNRELWALAVAILALAIGLIALIGFAAGVERAERARFAFAPGLFVAAGVAWRVALVNRSGFAQLDPWLLAGPTLAAAAFALSAPRRFRAWLASPRGLAVLGVAAALGAVGLAADRPAAWLDRHGAWSPGALGVLRLATDLDGDGYSAWFAGRDCAAFDARVHPGAREIAKNGTDDNCLGGDGAGKPPFEAPAPSPLAEKLGAGRANVVIVSIETLRADRTSLLGYAQPTTPVLERLAEGAIVFERMYATTPTTRLSLPALLSGVLPSRLDWSPQAAVKQMRKLGPKSPWLPEILRARGYATFAVHADYRAFTAVESAGFDRGFDVYDASTPLGARGGTMRGFPGGRQVDRALELVATAGERPFLLWVHLLEPHYLYERSPDVPSFGTSEAALYAADIAEADRQVGRLLDGLAARGRLERSAVFVTGDHGEEFGEHGERWHGSNLYEPQVRTAAVLRIPGLGGRRVAEAVSLTDIVPTLLDALGVREGFERFDGRNLLPLLLARGSVGGALFLENFRVDNGADYSGALVDFPYKLIHVERTRTLELYDVSRDPGETRDLYVPGDPLAQRLANRLYQYLESRR